MRRGTWILCAGAAQTEPKSKPFSFPTVAIFVVGDKSALNLGVRKLELLLTVGTLTYSPFVA